MRPAAWTRSTGDPTRLLVIQEGAPEELRDERIADLPAMLRERHLVVLNDAATLPASLDARTKAGEDVELRLLGPPEGDRAQVVLLGEGTWRTRTEDRPAPPRLDVGEELALGTDLRARIDEIGGEGRRLARIRFSRSGAELWAALYRAGRPVQYAHVERPLSLWHVQTAYASRPWASEMPSAGRPLTWDILLAMRRRGIELATLTHAAGLSSVDGGRFDASLPLPEASDIPSDTAEAVARAQARGGRIIAVGTTVVRALEGRAVSAGRVTPGRAVTDLRLGATYRPRIVSGMLTGMHERGTSHFELMTAFAPAALLERGIDRATAAGYESHELGDACLVLPRA